MRVSKWAYLPAACALTCTALALADTTVEVKGVHLCCAGCVKGANKAVKSAKAKATCDREAGTVTITAKDDATAQKALDALANAGYHGDTGNATLTIKEVADVPSGKVKKLELTGVHNCCGACCKAIKAAVRTVDGVSGDTAKPKSANFAVTGDFDAAAVVKALSDAGFHVKVKKEE